MGISAHLGRNIVSLNNNYDYLENETLVGINQMGHLKPGFDL
jgi:hypothetical protein